MQIYCKNVKKDFIYNSDDYLAIKDNNKVNNLYMYSPTVAVAGISIRQMVVEEAMNG